MKIRGFLSAFFLLLLAGCTTDFNEVVRLEEQEVKEMFAGKDVVANVLTVKFSRSTADELSVSRTRSGELTTGNITLDEICREYDVVAIERVFPVNKFEARKREMGLHQWYTVKVGERHSAGETALRFNEIEEVELVTPQVKVHRMGSSEVRYATEEEIASLSIDNPTRSDTSFNDPLLPEQWMLKNIGAESEYYGSYGFVAGADINVEGAWEKCGGSNNVIVSVVDGGIEYTHPDLAPNMWEGIGRNFVGNSKGSTNVIAEEHGTHVAGTIAAVSNNGIGIAGIAGGSGRSDGVKLMSCQIFTNEDSATDTESAAAIVFGADNGAVISQNSWGYPIDYVYNDATFNSRLKLIKDAIDYFVKYAGMDENGNQVAPMAGGVVIFAAGNDGKQQSEYPASYSECLSVAAMSGNYRAAWYSTYSNMVDIFAPGGDGSSQYTQLDYPAWNLSTLPTSIKNGDTFKEDGKTYVVDYVRTSGYGYMRGTSMACPHVSGAAALIVSYCGGEGFTAARLKELMLDTSKSIDEYQDAAHKGKVGKLVDVTAALNKGGAGSNYVPKHFPLIRLKSESNELYMLPDDKSQIVYELTNCDRIEVSDPKVEINRIGDLLTIEIDASKYTEGLHKVIVTGYNNDGEVSVEFSISITDVSAKFYPNPCDDELNIQLSEIRGEYRNCNASVRISNSLGVVIFEKEATFNGRYPLHLDVSKLNPGQYTTTVDIEYEKAVYTLTQTVVKR